MLVVGRYTTKIVLTQMLLYASVLWRKCHFGGKMAFFNNTLLM